MKKFKKTGVYRNIGFFSGLGRGRWKCVKRDARSSGVTLVEFESDKGVRHKGRVKVIEGIETVLCSNVFDGRIVAVVPEK